MSTARDAILAGVRQSLARQRLAERDTGSVEARLAARPRGIIPNRVAGPHAALVDLFVTMAEGVSATVARLDGMTEVPDAIATFLADNNLPAAVKLAPDAALDGIDWSLRPMLDVSRGAATAADMTSMTACLAGVAETGTLVLASGAGSPTTLNFLPDNHIVLLHASQVVAAYEDAWDRLRALGSLPRTVNLVTGPSRTGDIEQIIQLGAHGPRRLHVLLIATGGP